MQRGQAEENVAALQAGDRLRALDGLRGIAILLVIFLHYVARAPVPPMARPLLGQPLWLRAVADMSWCGVDLFFVLSGFLIGGILLDHRESPNLWRAFYSRRVGRIFPAYFLLLLLAVVGLPGDRTPDAEAVPLLPYFLFVQNLWPGAAHFMWLGPCWSIAIEEQFYLAAPAIIARVSRRSLPFLMALCILGPLALRSALLFAPQWLPVHWNPWDFTLCRIDGPAWGVLGAWLVREASTQRALKASLPALKVAAAVLVTAVLAMSQARPYAWNDQLIQSIGLTLLSATSLALILIAVLDPEGLLPRVLRWPILTTPGKYSYFLYLFHLVLFMQASRMGPPLWRIELVSVLSLSVLAWLSFRFFETPLLRLARSVRYEPAAVPGGTLPVGATGRP